MEDTLAHTWPTLWFVFGICNPYIQLHDAPLLCACIWLIPFGSCFHWELMANQWNQYEHANMELSPHMQFGEETALRLHEEHTLTTDK